MPYFTPTVPMPDTCPECGATGVPMTRYVCKPCYGKHWRAGTTDSLPRAEPLRRDHKPCARCGEIKAFSEFSKNNRTREGIASHCKACYRKKYAAKAKAPAPVDASGSKDCSACKATLPLSRFYWRSDQSRYRNECIDCRSAKDAERRQDPQSGYETRRRNRLVGMYGLDQDRYEEMLESQGGGCAICGRPKNPDGKYLHVDHCHATGKVRGILCSPCNNAIGLLGDNPELLIKGAAYLNR